MVENKAKINAKKQAVTWEDPIKGNSNNFVTQFVFMENFFI